jgi:hypothetical protein
MTDAPGATLCAKIRCSAAIWMRRQRQSGWESGVAAFG